MSDETTTRGRRLRKLGRRRRLSTPQPGFAGPGHTAIEVVTPEALVETDPFVLLMDDRIDFPAGQQVGGPHPHAGLETVTLVLEGSLADRDEGLLHAGDALWMTAGRGVVHNEDVRAVTAVRALQLWVTLPERERAAPPRFDVLRSAELPVLRAHGVEARLYSGHTNGLTSPTKNHVPVTLIDIHLAPGAAFEHELPPSYNGFLYPLAGALRIADGPEPLHAGEVGWLERGDDHPSTLRILAEGDGARVLLYAGQRQNEPTVQHGPFVAGSAAAIERMFREYRAGLFTKLSELAHARPAPPL